MTGTPRTKAGRPFTMVRRSIWGSIRFCSLPDDDCRYLYFYLLTCPHQTSSGCMILKEAYALADLQLFGADWDAEKFRAKTSEIESSGLILTDAMTGEILITRWWDQNGPNNQKWFEGARTQCEAITSEDLRKAAHEALETSWQTFISAKGSPPPIRAGQPATFPTAADKLNAVHRRVA